MSNRNWRAPLVLLACAVFLLLGCETADLIRNVSARPTHTRTIPREPTEKPTRAPDAPFDFETVGTPRCAAGDETASIVQGRIVQDGAPVVAQQVQASSGPGAEPISETPAQSDDKGNFQVTFVCDGKACNGAFWVWLINDNNEQISPFVEFIFDKQCRRGTVNFAAQ